MSKITFKSNVETHESTKEASEMADHLLQVNSKFILNILLYYINRLLPILPCSNGEAPTPMRVSRAEMKSLASIISLKMSLGNILIFMNIRVDVLSRITGSVATVSSQQNSNVRRRRDSLSQENISNNRGGSLVNYDGSRRRKTVAFNPTLEVNNYNNSSSRRDSEGLSQQLSTL